MNRNIKFNKTNEISIKIKIAINDEQNASRVMPKAYFDVNEENPLKQ